MEDAAGARAAKVARTTAGDIVASATIVQSAWAATDGGQHSEHPPEQYDEDVEEGRAATLSRVSAPYYRVHLDGPNEVKALLALSERDSYRPAVLERRVVQLTTSELCDDERLAELGRHVRERRAQRGERRAEEHVSRAWVPVRGSMRALPATEHLLERGEHERINGRPALRLEAMGCATQTRGALETV